MNLSDPVTPGTGYWIITLDAADIDVEGTYVQPTNFAQCAASAGCIEIDLTEPAAGDSGQFQILARPFPGTIARKDVRVFDGVNVYTPNSAQGAQVLSKTLHKYNGSTYVAYDDVTVGMEGELLPSGGLLGAHPENAPAGTRLLIPGEPEPTPASP
ncbi:MAG: hypothetical protein M5U09_20010 [Gammaproteobacteria bacterium]|nr:hypothetical protein [Gammaproteobacteria bacterium]